MSEVHSPVQLEAAGSLLLMLGGAVNLSDGEELFGPAFTMVVTVELVSSRTSQHSSR